MIINNNITYLLYSKYNNNQFHKSFVSSFFSIGLRVPMTKTLCVFRRHHALYMIAIQAVTN
jgi:hypothetical protein